MGSSFSCVMHEQANILVITLPQEMTMHVEMFLSEQHVRKSTTQSRETEGLIPLWKVIVVQDQVFLPKELY